MDEGANATGQTGVVDNIACAFYPFLMKNRQRPLSLRYFALTAIRLCARNSKSRLPEVALTEPRKSPKPVLSASLGLASSDDWTVGSRCPYLCLGLWLR